MDYTTLKLVHQGTVALSIGGFFARGLGALSGSVWVRARPARTLPHIVDTVLLASAIGLAWSLQLNPLTTPWLAAKIAWLLAYIGMGMRALRPRRSRTQRLLTWIAALLCFAQIVAVAITKHASGVFSLL